jgi:hypothetical protein
MRKLAASYWHCSGGQRDAEETHTQLAAVSLKWRKETVMPKMAVRAVSDFITVFF